MNRREVMGSVGSVALLPVFAVTHGEAPAPLVAAAFEARLLLESPQSGVGNHRWAPVTGGAVTGDLLRGRVQSGRLDWHVDPASGAVAVAVTCSILRADGALVELRDRTVSARPVQLAEEPGFSTAPRLFDAGGRDLAVRARLAGCLNADIGRGTLQLRVFDLQ